MCGIAGIFRYAPSHQAALDPTIGQKMIDTLIHRGPDDGGLLVTNDVLLGHRRLSILDPSDDGHQPTCDEQQQVWLTYNGEIYNYASLRQELQQAGHAFHSRTDTEVLLRGYLHWGKQVLRHVQGMFAFAIWDRRNHSLFAARDPVGIKPFVYSDDGTCLRFGSEAKAILADQSVPRDVDWIAIDRYMAMGYVPAPRTGYEQLRSLLPGHCLEANSQGVSIERYFQWPYPDAAPQASFSESVENLAHAIDQSVQRQLVSDVPLGALLSGGLDSSAVVGSMKRVSSASIQTFTIGFDEASFDESRYASQVSQIYGVHHVLERIDDRASDWLLSVVAHNDEPFADNSSLAFFALAKSVRKHVTVALSGDGADELLAGYSTYRASELAPYYRVIPSPLRKHVLEPLVRRLPRTSKKYSLAMFANRFVDAAGLASPYDHCNWRRMVGERLSKQLFTGALSSRDDQYHEYAQAIQSGPSWLSANEQYLHGDLCFHLPNDMLVKVDRMSMAHSLEVRVPLLDLQVIEACLTIPYSFKRVGNDGKRVLKAMLRRELPAEIVDRKKAGFVVPLERWLAGPWNDLLQRYLTESFAAETGVLQWPALREMIQSQLTGRADHSYALFTLLNFALWWRVWIKQDLSADLVRPTQWRPTRWMKLAATV